MYSFTKIEDLNIPEFRVLFDQTEYAFDPNTWMSLGVENSTSDEKFNAIKNLANTALQNKGYLVYLVRDPQGVPIKLDFGVSESYNNGFYFLNSMSLTGVDSNSSKSWLHDDDYNDGSLNFLRELGFAGRSGVVYPGTEVANFLKKTVTHRFTYSEVPVSNNRIHYYLTYN